MSAFTNPILPALSGKQEAVVKSYREVSNDKGGYLEVIFKLQDRDYTLNVFPGKGETANRQINYIGGAIRKQLGKANETLSLTQILELAKKTPINIWFSYSQEFERMNVNFHEPVNIGSVNVDEIPA